MKIKRLLLSVLLLGSLVGYAMTDAEVMAYIKTGMQQGKSKQQIGRELVAKGVTREQAERIKSAYESEELADKNVTNQTVQEARSERKHSVTDNVSTAVVEDINMEVTKQHEGNLPEEEIYGHSVFNSPNLTFEPSDNLATPQSYRLGPGDEVIIDIWGTSEDHLRKTISPEGSIMIDQVGPVYLNGMTINDANQHIKNAFSKKYAGVKDSETDIQVTLGQVRSIQVDLMGEVAVPGTYRLSPFSTVFHALHRAGGINDVGTLRNVQVLRNGKKIAGVDIYEYLFDGKTSGNIRLQEGDVIIVPPYETRVSIKGNIKRPMYYEVKPNESIETLIDYAGGFSGDAYTENVRVDRTTGGENELYNIAKNEFGTYHLQNGDVVTVCPALNRYSNRVELRGAVYRPGMFAISNELRTVKDLINMADGLTEDAYMERAQLYREGPNLELQVIALDLRDILNGNADDVELKRNDMLVISTIDQLQERGSFTIDGMVANPGEYPYAENFTLQDLIFRAGGLLEGASKARVDISRRIVDPMATEQTERISKLFSVSIEGGLAVGNGENFILEPYDMVHVRRSPGYVAQETVMVNGEVLFDGSYTLQKRNERLSDIVRRAGGVVEGAYIKGAYLTRRMTEDEFQSKKATLQLALANSQGGVGDSISLDKLGLTPNYNVGINLAKALENPGSHYDVILQPGDVLFVPQQQSTVKVSGDVLYPNAVVYEPGLKVKDYINKAGGYGQTAKKNAVFVVYMNGSVAKAKGSTVLEPGCQIIVPTKSANSGTDWTKIFTLASGFSSIATMAAAVANMVRK